MLPDGPHIKTILNEGENISQSKISISFSDILTNLPSHLPKFLENSQNKFLANEEENAYVQLEVFGDPAPSIKWFRWKTSRDRKV